MLHIKKTRVQNTITRKRLSTQGDRLSLKIQYNAEYNNNNVLHNEIYPTSSNEKYAYRVTRVNTTNIARVRCSEKNNYYGLLLYYPFSPSKLAALSTHGCHRCLLLSALLFRPSRCRWWWRCCCSNLENITHRLITIGYRGGWKCCYVTFEKPNERKKCTMWWCESRRQ